MQEIDIEELDIDTRHKNNKHYIQTQQATYNYERKNLINHDDPVD